MHMHQGISYLQHVLQAVLELWCLFTAQDVALSAFKAAALDFEGQNILLSCLLSWDKHQCIRQGSIPIYSMGNSAGINCIWK